MGDINTILVQSDVLPDGSYVLAIHYGQDQSRVLTRAAALRYAAAVHAAATRAEHDAAVVAQLTETGLPRHALAGALIDLRNQRPPLNGKATGPLELNPCVSATHGHGFLEVRIAGRLTGQWTPGDARDHAGNVLDALEAVDLDTAYRRYLIKDIGVDPTTAAAAVGDLGNHIKEAGRG